MKKIVLIMLALFCMASVAYAEDLVWFEIKGEAGIGISGDPGSKMFNGAYAYCDSAIAGTATFAFGGELTLNIQIIESVILASGLNYRYTSISNEIYLLKDTIDVEIKDHSINIPALLRFGGRKAYFETGVQWGIPMSSKAKVSNKRLGINDRYNDDDFRSERDLWIIVGFFVAEIPSVPPIGLRLTIPTNKLDKYGGVNNPVIFSFNMGVSFLNF